MISGGKELQHSVNFDSGLHATNTAQSLKNSVRLWLVNDERRRLSEEGNTLVE